MANENWTLCFCGADIRKAAGFHRWFCPFPLWSLTEDEARAEQWQAEKTAAIHEAARIEASE